MGVRFKFLAGRFWWLWGAGIVYLFVLPLGLAIHAFLPQIEGLGVFITFGCAILSFVVGGKLLKLRQLLDVLASGFLLLSMGLAIVHGWTDAVLLVYVGLGLLCIIAFRRFARQTTGR